MFFNFFSPITLILYIPVFLALYVVATHYKQIHWIWLVILTLGIFTGAGPFAALVFLVAQRKMLQGKTEPVVGRAAPIQPQVAMPGGQQAPVLQTASAVATGGGFQITPQRVAGTALGTVVTVVLWVSGLIAVGFFVIITIAVIQCANQPKCM